MAFTGGPLNLLNGKMGISAPHRSVAVMKLIRAHQPVSRRELEELIAWHAGNQCECGIVSKGTIQSFGENLYNAQKEYWGEYRYSLKECIQWEYDLFITQSLKGGLMERKALLELKMRLPELELTEAEGYMDEELRIDIIAAKEGVTLGGVQIKPLTFMKMRSEVITFNRTANKKWGRPVYYLYYDKDENFINLIEVILRLEDQFLNG
jgi:hypothetical protein